MHDARRLEIVAEGLPPCGGAQLALDTTLDRRCSAGRGQTPQGKGLSRAGGEVGGETRGIGQRGWRTVVKGNDDVLEIVGVKMHFRDEGLNRLGACGEACWRVPPDVPLRPLCRSNVPMVVGMATRP